MPSEGVISAAYPPPISRKSAGFSTPVPLRIRRISTRFPPVLRRIFINVCREDFHRVFRTFSEAFSRLGRREKGRKASGRCELRKTRRSGARARFDEPFSLPPRRTANECVHLAACTGSVTRGTREVSRGRRAPPGVGRVFEERLSCGIEAAKAPTYFSGGRQAAGHDAFPYRRAHSARQIPAPTSVGRYAPFVLNDPPPRRPHGRRYIISGAVAPFDPRPDTIGH